MYLYLYILGSVLVYMHHYDLRLLTTQVNKLVQYII